MDSIYLYDKQNRDLYLKSFSKPHCPHSKKILSVLDKGFFEVKNHELSSHVQKCSECRDQLAAMSSKLREIEFLIPHEKPSDEVLKRYHSKLASYEELPWKNMLRDFLMTDLKVYLKPCLKSMLDPRVQVVFLCMVSIYILQAFLN